MLDLDRAKAALRLLPRGRSTRALSFAGDPVVIRRNSTGIALVVMTCGINGCYTTQRLYEGAELPRDKVAIIKNIPRMPNLMDKEVIIRSANGREAGLYDAGVSVLSGTVELVVMCVWRRGGGPMRSVEQSFGRLRATVESGKTYQLDAKSGGACFPFLIEAK